MATARTARRMSPIRTACKASAAAPVRLQPASLLSKVPPVSSLALNGRREETDEVILQQVTKLQNSLMQQIESTKQQIQRQTAHGAKQVNGHLNPQAVAALSLHGAPVARPVAGTVPALPRSAAAPPARPVAPGAGSLTLPPKPERVERVERVEVLSRSVKLTLPVKEEMEGSQGAQNGRGVRAGAAAARIQRAWKKRKSSRPEVRPEEALPPPVKRLAPQHWAASRIQRAWKISRWRRVFIVDCKRDLGWLGSLDWLQRHNMLYGTELAETEDLEWWYHQQSGAPLDYEVDPWGCRKLREHLNRMWFGGEEPPPEPPARPAPGRARGAPGAEAREPGRVQRGRARGAHASAGPSAEPGGAGGGAAAGGDGDLAAGGGPPASECLGSHPTPLRLAYADPHAPAGAQCRGTGACPGERGAAKHHGLPGASAGASAGPHGVLRAAVATRQPAKLSAARGSEPGRCGSGAGLRGRPGARL